MTGTGSSSDVAVQVCPIGDVDLDDVARFLGGHLPPDTPPDRWADAWRQSVNRPGSDAPNHGYMLRVGDVVVGAYLAIYSTRVIDGVVQRFCNLGAWYVEPDHRRHSIRLMKALVDQEGWHFTELAPSVPVQRLDHRMGFDYLDTTTALFPNLPWPTFPGRARVTADPGVIRSHLADPFLTYYDDHSRSRWARHLVIVRGGESCYVQWRKERRKNLKLLASIRYASNPRLLRQEMWALGRYLLLHHGTVASLVEVRLAEGRVRPSVLMPKPVARMYKSDTLGPESIDYLYSEISSAP